MKTKLKQFSAKNSNPMLNVAKGGIVLYSNEAGEPLLHEWGLKVGDKLPSTIGDIVQRVISQDRPENLDIEDLDTLGMQLVTSLVDQLDGELELKRDNGAAFIIRFTVT